MREWMIALTAVAGCYNPSAPSGAPCANNFACPTGQNCQLGSCVVEPGGTHDGAVVSDANGDAAIKPDGSTTDAAAGAPHPVVPTGTGVGAFTLDASYVYWSQNSMLVRMLKAGGVPEVVVPDAGTSPESIAVDDTNIYWSDYSNNRVMRAALADGNPIAVTTGIGASPQSLVLDGTKIYFPTDGTTSSIISVAKTGGPRTSLIAQHGPDAIALAGGFVYWVSGSSDGDGTIDRIDLADDTNHVIATPGGGFGDIAVDATSVYVGASTKLLQVPTIGGPVAMLASGQANIARLAVGPTSVFWTNYVVDGSVMRASKSVIGPAEPVALAQNRPSAIALDGSTLYWVADGGLLKLDVTDP